MTDGSILQGEWNLSADGKESMVMEKKLYPLRFVPIASPRVWGGNALINRLGKRFVIVDEDGNEVELTSDDCIGESWELADMGFEDSVVSEGWLAGNTISEVMETYLERVVGEPVYNYFGRQFPVLLKFLDIQGKLSVQVHPDDEMAAERYDSLGKSEMWYVVDAAPGSKVYVGFNRDMTAQELYDRCQNGTVDEVLNVIHPKKGDVIFMTPGTVHSAEGGLLIAEIQESSDLNFRLYDWGREHDPVTARPMHLEEAIDLIDYSKFDGSKYRKGPMWHDEGCHCHEDECHCHEHEGHEHEVAEVLVETPQFNVTKIALKDSLHIYTDKFESYIVYMCIEGEASVQVPSSEEGVGEHMERYVIKAGETLLIPAEMPDFYLVPHDRSTVLLEIVTRPAEEEDSYIDPDTEAFLEGEDYEGIEEDDYAGED